MTEDLSIRQFNIREADWQADGSQLSNIRRLVFIVEQKVPKEEEWDDKDGDAWHWIATDESDVPIGTARLLPDGQIGRMAVLKEYRHLGVGAALLEQAVEKARHLGLPEAFLNAQKHALGFYERGGFTIAGDEFFEAGIPHYRMTRALTLPEDNIQRLLGETLSADIGVKPFDTSEVLWSELQTSIRRVRRQVFSIELGDTAFTEEDDEDQSAIHWTATNDDNHVTGVVRMTAKGDVTQLAVVSEARHLGIGSTLLELAFQRARRFSLNTIRVHHDGPAGFLEKCGFKAVGSGVFERAIPPEDREVSRREDGAEARPEGVTYQLGVDKQLILLRRESEFRNVILEMAAQARQYIRIYSPVLSHDLFDDKQLQTICSRLARRNRYTRIEILVFDPHRIIKNGHALLSIARKLPSSISIKVVDPDMRQQNHEYVVVDGEGYVYRGEHDSYEGTAAFLDITECNRLGRQFTACWESGLLDPNLRQLRI